MVTSAGRSWSSTSFPTTTSRSPRCRRSRRTSSDASQVAVAFSFSASGPESRVGAQADAEPGPVEVLRRHDPQGIGRRQEHRQAIVVESRFRFGDDESLASTTRWSGRRHTPSTTSKRPACRPCSKAGRSAQTVVVAFPSELTIQAPTRSSAKWLGADGRIATRTDLAASHPEPWAAGRPPLPGGPPPLPPGPPACPAQAAPARASETARAIPNDRTLTFTFSSFLNPARPGYLKFPHLLKPRM